jgi:hypothetical protein
LPWSTTTSLQTLDLRSRVELLNACVGDRGVQQLQAVAPLGSSMTFMAGQTNHSLWQNDPKIGLVDAQYVVWDVYCAPLDELLRSLAQPVSISDITLIKFDTEVRGETAAVVLLLLLLLLSVVVVVTVVVVVVALL